MKKTVAGSFIIFLFFASLTCANAQNKCGEKEAISATRKIFFNKGKPNGFICTGFAIKSDKPGFINVVTAGHCVSYRNKRLKEVVSNNSTIHFILKNKLKGKSITLRGKLLAFDFKDRDHDIAVFEIKSNKHIIPLELSPTDSELGEKIFMVGYPNGKFFKGYGQVFTEFSEMKEDKVSMIHQRVVMPKLGEPFGASGSAIISCKNKKVVGILVRKSAGRIRDHIDILPISTFRNWWKKAKLNLPK